MEEQKMTKALPDKWKAIRKDYKRDMTWDDLAKKHRVSLATVSRATKGLSRRLKKKSPTKKEHKPKSKAIQKHERVSVAVEALEAANDKYNAVQQAIADLSKVLIDFDPSLATITINLHTNRAKAIKLVEVEL